MSRWRVELGTAAAFVVLALVTAVEPQWIERLSGAEPDGGSGSLEWGLVALLGVVALVLAALGLRDRARALASPPAQ